MYVSLKFMCSMKYMLSCMVCRIADVSCLCMEGWMRCTNYIDHGSYMEYLSAELFTHEICVQFSNCQFNSSFLMLCCCFLSFSVLSLLKNLFYYPLHLFFIFFLPLTLVNWIAQIDFPLNMEDIMLVLPRGWLSGKWFV